MADVRVILRDDVVNLGDAGDVVAVKAGYARNYLIPQGKALVATEAKVKQLEHEKQVIEERLAKDLKDLKAVARKVDGTVVEVSANAGEGGKLFGSVTTQQIAALLAEQGVTVDRRRIQTDPIRTVGEHTVKVRLHRELSVKVKVIVTGTAPVQAPSGPDLSDVIEEDNESPFSEPVPTEE
jgi:large subunit ribosomal protein L9